MERESRRSTRENTADIHDHNHPTLVKVWLPVDRPTTPVQQRRNVRNSTAVLMPRVMSVSALHRSRERERKRITVNKFFALAENRRDPFLSSVECRTLTTFS